MLKAWISAFPNASTKGDALPLEIKSLHVFVGNFQDHFIVEIDALQLCTHLTPEMLQEALSTTKTLYISDEASNFKMALRLLREGKIDASMKHSPLALQRHVDIAKRYGISFLLSDLEDRVSIAQSIVLPEVAAMLESNPHRKLLLLKQVVKKARAQDVYSGGSLHMQSKLARLKIAKLLCEACENKSFTRAWRERYVALATTLLTEGGANNSQLDALVKELTEKTIPALKHKYLEQGDDDDDVGAMEEDGSSAIKRLRIEKDVKPVQVVRFVPKKETTAQHHVAVNVGNQREFVLLDKELEDLGVFHVHTTENNSFFVMDDAARFELALHLVRCQGKLEPNEKADLGILKSYRNIALAYRIRNPNVLRRLNNWISAHRNGVIGADTVRQEIRALELTRLVNPERGNAIVSSALSSAYLQRATTESTTTVAKQQALLCKAELHLRTVLPVMLTTLSVSRLSPEQQSSIDESIAMLKQILRLQNRLAEVDEVDHVVKQFVHGVEDAAAQLNAMTRHAPQDMYG